MDVLQVLALVCFLCAAVLAYAGDRYERYRGGWWAILIALGLAFWLLSETKVLS